ncbi:MAG: hypothetical protein KatS3mg059_1538 [Thermomicrobiales bacterium]|nr:MAG: hypothetical protein KatS3mg059_1538 [Thermomicrobiales bacterium]
MIRRFLRSCIAMACSVRGIFPFALAGIAPDYSTAICCSPIQGLPAEWATRSPSDSLPSISTPLPPPSIWGAGLAQWVGYFLEPKAKVVDATPADHGLTIAEKLTGFIAGCRVLLVDNLIVSGQTMTQFAQVVSSHGATVAGIATLWSLGPETIAGFPVYALLNDVYPAYEPGACPLCAAGASAPEPVAY